MINLVITYVDIKIQFGDRRRWIGGGDRLQPGTIFFFFYIMCFVGKEIHFVYLFVRMMMMMMLVMEVAVEVEWELDGGRRWRWW